MALRGNIYLVGVDVQGGNYFSGLLLVHPFLQAWRPHMELVEKPQRGTCWTVTLLCGGVLLGFRL